MRFWLVFFTCILCLGLIMPLDAQEAKKVEKQDTQSTSLGLVSPGDITGKCPTSCSDCKKPCPKVQKDKTVCPTMCPSKCKVEKCSCKAHCPKSCLACKAGKCPYKSSCSKECLCAKGVPCKAKPPVKIDKPQDQKVDISQHIYYIDLGGVTVKVTLKGSQKAIRKLMEKEVRLRKKILALHQNIGKVQHSISDIYKELGFRCPGLEKLFAKWVQCTKQCERQNLNLLQQLQKMLVVPKKPAAPKPAVKSPVVKPVPKAPVDTPKPPVEQTVPQPAPTKEEVKSEPQTAPVPQPAPVQEEVKPAPQTAPVPQPAPVQEEVKPAPQTAPETPSK